MKTIRFKCYAACCMAFLGMGCTASFEEYNTNPNQMEMWEIGPESLLENLVFKEFECLLHRTWYINGELIQYTVSGSSLNAFHRYVISNGVPSDHWATQFQWAATADHMYRLALEQNDVNCQAIALTMRAFCMAHCTDGFGDVPFTEAFQGRDGLAQPLFDTQRSIYERLYEDLELANSLYDVSKSLKSPSRDLLYGGDMAKWKRFTNSLHLRLLMRCINRDGELGISERIRSLVSQPTLYPLFESNDDNATLFYTGVVPFVNYFKNTTYENFTTYGRRASASFVDRMAAIGDPRLSIYFVRRGDAWGGYPSGEPVDETTTTENVANLNWEVLAQSTSPFSVMRYDEVLFLLAEAAQRGVIAGVGAEEYYEAAIRASIGYWHGVDTSGAELPESVIEAYLQNVAYDGTLRCIIEQKYIALFWCGMEAWNEYRRTGYPELTIGSATSNDHILPTRFEYPVNTSTTNPVNYAQAVARLAESWPGGGDNMRTPVWWSLQAARQSQIARIYDRRRFANFSALLECPRMVDSLPLRRRVDRRVARRGRFRRAFLGDRRRERPCRVALRPFGDLCRRRTDAHARSAAAGARACDCDEFYRKTGGGVCCFVRRVGDLQRRMACRGVAGGRGMALAGRTYRHPVECRLRGQRHGCIARGRGAALHSRNGVRSVARRETVEQLNNENRL